ncbi:MAG TPA: hypothetical protein VKA46_01570 [Gemmataceae bacterium]|nr:hypothetical protein [Gemmataceae bacterium]
MSQPESNGVPRNPQQPIILADGSQLFRLSEDDPDAIVQSWPNGDGPRDDYAFPPKSDQIRETPEQELMALVNAMTAYKRKLGLQFLLWEHVLDVLHDMGYRKVISPAEAPTPATATTP